MSAAKKKAKAEWKWLKVIYAKFEEIESNEKLIRDEVNDINKRLDKLERR
jgi:hypothetical protein